jgi:uncharacterized protein (DUF2267 family)
MIALQQRTGSPSLDACHAVFAAVLVNLRTHMETHDVLALAGMLPDLPRGVFLDGYQPSHALPSGAPSTFLREVKEDLPEGLVIPDTAVADVFSVIAQHTDVRVAAHMREKLPELLQTLWPESAANRAASES